MSDLARELGVGCLTQDQVEAITNAWCDLLSAHKLATSEMFNGESPGTQRELHALAAATKDSAEELEKEFPFLWDVEE